jgi:serine/threonine protein kinase
LYGKFSIERRIGKGGMGVVYKARDLMLRRTVAIKTLPRVSPEHTYRLRREARTMASVQHPHLAIIYDMESWEGIPLMIMEYLGGGTLKRRIASGPLPIADAVGIALTISATLVRTHRAGILHRDLKPSNIGFDSEGTVKILDFGIAHILPMIPSSQRLPGTFHGAELSLSSTTVSLAAPTWDRSDRASMYAIGTPLYMSPEALSHHRPHPSFDTWALAIVLYEMITGRHPLLQPGKQIQSEDLLKPRIPELRALRADCPPSLATFVHRALSQNMDERPNTAAAFHQMLSDASEGQPTR